MKIDAAVTWRSRLLFRISTDPTASARTLRAVINLHAPVEGTAGAAICSHCIGRAAGPTPYPCMDAQVIAMELGVPLPEVRAYDALTDG